MTAPSIAHRLAALALAALAATPALAAWEPTAPVELVVPAGPGGGADQMARFIQQMVAKHGLMKQPLTVVNKAENSGVEGLLDVKAAKGNPNKLIITLSNLFTTPLATGTDFNWRDITPVEMLALDQFVLWVNVASPHKTAKDALDALRVAPPGSVKLGGTGRKQEDQLISVLLETAASTRIAYVPLKGGGDVANTLAAGEVDLTVNNPIEAESHWRAGKLRALCVFDKDKLPYPTKLSHGMSWADVPTCTSAGIPVEYVMLRGIFMPPGVSKDQQAFYVDLLAKVRATPDWKDFMEKGAFRQTALTGEEYFNWVAKNEQMHRELMKQAGFIAQ